MSVDYSNLASVLTFTKRTSRKGSWSTFLNASPSLMGGTWFLCLTTHWGLWSGRRWSSRLTWMQWHWWKQRKLSDAIFCHMRIWNSQVTFPRVVKNNHYRRVYLRYSPWLCMRTDINTDNDHHQPCMSLAQLVSFNTVAQQRSKSQLSRHGFVNRHCQSTLVLTSIRELEVRPSSRRWTAWGCVCVSYSRVLQIEEWLATSVTERFHNDGVVCPPKLRNGLFTVAALDNIDHDPTSNTSWRKVQDRWEPVWTVEPIVSSACQRLIKCTCKNVCRVCKCARAELKCTYLCKCECAE